MVMTAKIKPNTEHLKNLRELTNELEMNIDAGNSPFLEIGNKRIVLTKKEMFDCLSFLDKLTKNEKAKIVKQIIIQE